METTTREERGRALYEARGDKIVQVGDISSWEYRVPGSRGETYEVHVPTCTCTCPDRPPRGEGCKHVEAARLRDKELKDAAGYYDDLDFKDLL